MATLESFGWVDRRRVHCPVGRDRRVSETRGLGNTKMRRDVLDWFYRYRWWPWLITLLIVPGHLWPTSYWFEVQSVAIQSAPFGAQLPMQIERRVVRDFRGTWSATIRQWDGNGWVTWCNAHGRSNYRPEAKFPKDLALKWWTDGQCYPLPPGRYKVSTSWRVETPAWAPDKFVTAESNVFEVMP